MLSQSCNSRPRRMSRLPGVARSGTTLISQIYLLRKWPSTKALASLARRGVVMVRNLAPATGSRKGTNPALDDRQRDTLRRGDSLGDASNSRTREVRSK